MEGPDTPISPLPARPAAEPGPGAGGGNVGGAGPPIPARAARGAGGGAPEGTAQPPDPVELEVDGVRWTVSVLGASGSARAPLLLLGFSAEGSSAAPGREAWVVARSLSGLTELQVQAAWRDSTPTAPSGTRRPFFPEIAARGAKDG